MVASVTLHSIVPASLTTLAVATALYLAAETSADLVRLRTGG